MLMYDELSNKVLEGIFAVHSALGPGLLEAPYHKALVSKYRKMNIQTESKVPFRILFEEEVVGEYYADLILEDKILVEVKSVKELTDVMRAQVINYLRISQLKVGYLVNFNGDRAIWERMIHE
jgi:GxxExxY protein